MDYAQVNKLYNESTEFTKTKIREQDTISLLILQKLIFKE